MIRNAFSRRDWSKDNKLMAADYDDDIIGRNN